MSGSRAGGVLVFAAVLGCGVMALGPPDLPGLAASRVPGLPAAEAGLGGECPSRVEPWSREQTRNAVTIVEVGREMDMPGRAIVVALATAMQESGLRNLNYGAPGEDSYGLFQQRPSQGWGSREQVMDPEHAAASFYRTLERVDGWQDMRVTEAAQRVQRSAYPEAYEKWADEAEELATAIERCDR